MAQLGGPPGKLHGKSPAGASAQTSYVRQELRIEADVHIVFRANVIAFLMSVNFHSYTSGVTSAYRWAAGKP